MLSALDHLLTQNAWIVYTAVGLLVFAEDAIFVGFVIPGETAAVLGGVSASQGHVVLAWVCLLVVAAAITGDSVGYEVGRHFGPRILALRPLRRHQGRLNDARRFLARSGGLAVFLGRFVAFFRAVMPALAGLSLMPYRRFLAFNALGGLVWGISFVLLGYLAGNSYAQIEKLVGRGVAAGAVVLALLVFIAWRVRHARAERDPAPAPETQRD
jgi:membrane protein DedA with SNARE-associated domain